MKTILTSLAALAAVSAIAAPAAAQSWDRHDRGRVEAPAHNPRYGHDYGINQRQERLETRIEQGMRRGGLTMSEARRLRAEFRQIAQLEARYRRGGLSRWERADLDHRFDRLEAQIRFERRDRDYGMRR